MIISLDSFYLIHYVEHPHLESKIAKANQELIKLMKKSVLERGPEIYSFTESAPDLVEHDYSVDVYVFNNVAFIIETVSSSVLSNTKKFLGAGFIMFNTNNTDMKALKKSLFEILNENNESGLKRLKKKLQTPICVKGDWKEFFDTKPNLYELLHTNGFYDEKYLRKHQEVLKFQV